MNEEQTLSLEQVVALFIREVNTEIADSTTGLLTHDDLAAPSQADRCRAIHFGLALQRRITSWQDLSRQIDDLLEDPPVSSATDIPRRGCVYAA